MIGAILRSNRARWFTLDVLETKRKNRFASEYQPYCCHMDRGGSKTHPEQQSAARYQHIVLKVVKSKVDTQFLKSIFEVQWMKMVCGVSFMLFQGLKMYYGIC